LTGTIALGNTYEGVYAERSPSNTIGGAVSGAGNLISGNNTRGIWLTNASWNAIQGNLIGTRSDGISGLGNTFHNLECEVGACNNTIGGMGWAGNRIAFAQSIYAGVRIRNGSTNNAILGNAIFSTALWESTWAAPAPMRIFRAARVSGANMAQNYPVLAQAVTGTGTGVRGSLNSRANNAFLLEFFANSTCDSSGYGEGQIYLGQMSVVTGNDCNAGFVAGFPRSVPVGYSITATATDSANNTSEFSPCITAGPVPAFEDHPCHQSPGEYCLDEYDDRLWVEADHQSLSSDPMDCRDERPGGDQRAVRRHPVCRHRQPLLRPAFFNSVNRQHPLGPPIGHGQRSVYCNSTTCPQTPWKILRGSVLIHLLLHRQLI